MTRRRARRPRRRCMDAARAPARQLQGRGRRRRSARRSSRRTCPTPPQGPHAGRRRGQGRRRRWRSRSSSTGPPSAPLEGIVITRYGARPAHAVASAWSRPATRCPTRPARRRRSEILDARSALGAGRPAARAGLRRRLGAAVAAGRGDADGRPEGGHARAARSGAPIQDMNTVRKHLSPIQGGRLAAACSARVLALVISDVTGDDPTHIASGPCAPDPDHLRRMRSTSSRATASTAPASVAAHLERGARGELAETPKPGDQVFARAENRVIATAHAIAAGRRGITSQAHGMHAAGARRQRDRRSARGRQGLRARSRARCARTALPCAAAGGADLGRRDARSPCAASGRGGRCAEFLLSLADRAGRRRAHPGARLRHRRHRRREDNAGAVARARLACPRATALGPRRRSAARRQRRLRVLRGARRPRGHRPHAHQRERLPRSSWSQ